MINGVPTTHGFCTDHGLIRFTLKGKDSTMTREDAKRYYHQCKELLDGSVPDAHIKYPADHPERLKYEKKMAELVKKFPGIENQK